MNDIVIGHMLENKTLLVLHYMHESFAMNLFVKIAPGHRQEGLQALQEIYQETFGGEFHYTFLTDEREEIYREDQRVATLNVFDFPVTAGSFDAARSEQALISIDFARKLWGGSDPIGQTFLLHSGM